MEPAFCKKPWLKAVDLNLGEGKASPRGLLYLLMPLLMSQTDVFLLWHMGGTSLDHHLLGILLKFLVGVWGSIMVPLFGKKK